MALHKIDNFLWINVSIDDDKKGQLDVELKFEHGTDKDTIVTVLEAALKQVKNGIAIDHTHEKEKN
jgi:hypothetical protein